MKRFISLAAMLMVFSFGAQAQANAYSSASFLFDSSATTYTIGGVVTNATMLPLAFTQATSAGKYSNGTELKAIRISVDSASYIGGSFRCYFYPDTVGYQYIANDSAFTLDSLESVIQAGPYVDISLDSLGVGTGSTSAIGYSNLVTPIPLRVTRTDGKLFVRIVALGAWTAPQAKLMKVELWTRHD